MSDHWFVYRQGEQLGPWTSAQVREALREGRVDPFDLVAREGSAVRVELVEVDEIFRVTEQPGVQTTKQGRAFADLEQTDAHPLAHAVGQSAPGPAAAVPAVKPQPEVAGRKKSKRSSRKGGAGAASGRDAKKFYLIDRKKRQLGPLSAREVQSLYFRGIVSQSVRVVKAGSKRHVPVAQFVSVYAGARAQRIEDVTGHTQLAITKPSEGLPSSQVMEELARLRHAVGISSFPSKASIFMMALVVGALGYLIVSYLFLLPDAVLRDHWPWHQKPPTLTEPHRAPSLPQDTRVLQPASELRRPASQPQLEPAKQPMKAGATKAVAPPPPKKAERGKSPPPVRKTVTKPAVKQPAPKKTAPPQQRRAKVPPRVQPKAVIQPAPQRRAPAKVSPPTSATAGPTVAGSVGQVATFSGMRFDLAALQRCDAKCDITFSGAAGTVTVSFFKAAHGASLERSGGVVTITGRVTAQGNRYVMFLQGVR